MIFSLALLLCTISRVPVFSKVWFSILYNFFLKLIYYCYYLFLPGICLFWLDGYLDLIRTYFFLLIYIEWIWDFFIWVDLDLVLKLMGTCQFQLYRLSRLKLCKGSCSAKFWLIYILNDNPIAYSNSPWLATKKFNLMLPLIWWLKKILKF